MVTIERFHQSKHGTLGVLTTPGFECFTLERPWLDNEPNISCIPTGKYSVKPFTGRRFKQVVQVMDVLGRTHILIHSANRPSELSGCIAPGISYGFEGITPRVNHSRFALSQLFEYAGTEFELVIKSAQSQTQEIQHADAALP